jgi:hypothetical protein
VANAPKADELSQLKQTLSALRTDMVCLVNGQTKRSFSEPVTNNPLARALAAARVRTWLGFDGVIDHVKAERYLRVCGWKNIAPQQWIILDSGAHSLLEALSVQTRKDIEPFNEVLEWVLSSDAYLDYTALSKISQLEVMQR